MEVGLKDLVKDKRCILLSLLSFIAVGLFYWFIPYADISMFKMSFILTWALIGFLAGAMGVLLLKRGVLRSAVSVIAGFLLAVIGRIFYEVIADPMTHNLWPFEVGLTLLISIPSAFLGAFLVSFLRSRKAL